MNDETPWNSKPHGGAALIPGSRNCPSSTGLDRSSTSLVAIEDDAAHVRLIERMLEFRPAWHLSSAARGDDGFEKALQLKPDVILLDLNLADGCGEEVLRSLKSDQRTTHIPIVIVSGRVLALQAKENLSRQGAAELLPKPYTIAEFFEVLDRVLDRI